MQWRQYFPNIPNYYCYHSGRGNEGILSRRSRNDLSRLENHHDIDPATPGILLELWLLDYLMKMNVLTIILLLISDNLFGQKQSEDFTRRTQTPSLENPWGDGDPEKCFRFSHESMGANGTTFCISLGVDIKTGQARTLLLILLLIEICSVNSLLCLIAVEKLKFDCDDILPVVVIYLKQFTQFISDYWFTLTLTKSIKHEIITKVR